MSTWLIALVGVIYFYVGCEMAYHGRYALAIVWLGYSLAQAGLWHISR